MCFCCYGCFCYLFCLGASVVSSVVGSSVVCASVFFFSFMCCCFFCSNLVSSVSYNVAPSTQVTFESVYVLVWNFVLASPKSA